MAYSNATFQATAILLYIHFKTEEENYDYLSTKSISEMLNIPAPTVVKIISKLNGAGLVQTKEGAKGGNLLTRKISDITMLDVFTAVEPGKPLFKTQGSFDMEYEGLDSIVNKGVSCLVNAEKAMKASLQSVALAELIQ